MVLCDSVKEILGIDNLLTNDEVQLNCVCSTLKYSIPRWKRGLCSQFVDSGASCFANTRCSGTALCRKVTVPVQNQMDFSTAEIFFAIQVLKDSTKVSTGQWIVHSTAETSTTITEGSPHTRADVSTRTHFFRHAFPVASLMLPSEWNMEGGYAVNSQLITCPKSTSRWLTIRPITLA